MRKHPQRLLGSEAGNQRVDGKLAAFSRAGSGFMTAKLKTPSSCSSSLSSSAGSSAVVAKGKVEELFRRQQPHSLVLSAEKLLATLRIAPKLFVNGEELQPKAPPAPTIAVAAAGSRKPISTTAAWRFMPEAGRFRYGLSLQYSPSDPELTLSSLNDVSVMVTSSAMHTPRVLRFEKGNAINRKSWKLVAETDRRVGLALYELVLGDWGASSLIALVWTQKLEIARLFLQLHTTELLYSAPQRTLQFRCDDDLDRTHGLHSYTAAISLRSLDELFWERDVYQVEFAAPSTGASFVLVQLVDNVHGGMLAARDRVLTSETEPGLRVETEAVRYSMDNCILVDFTLWDAECVPVWGFSRVLELTAVSGQQQNEGGDSIDLSVTVAGGSATRMQAQFQDTARGNDLVVGLTKLSPSATPQQSSKKVKIWVSQVDLKLSLQFINATFGTKY
ncbi:unnamed protein product [Phytophthora lilii]|uniref:Unnamed protein product n=1 Tax=Phytophthora lilii TaxID=2077276 RepID=A0A9W6TH54_9STRA|nr:unnamed protein product [Phytophthora lilii]